MDELGTLIRGWRERADPVSAVDARRRTRGLRREELAVLSGVSSDYVVRLEQGRANRPSAQVLSALARALRLSDDETDLLFGAAGLTPPDAGIVRIADDGLLRLIDRVDQVALAAYSADWWLLAWNPSWTALLGDPATGEGLDRNLVWQVFASDGWRPRPRDRSAAEFRRELVSDLRAVAVEHPEDPVLTELLDALRGASDEFDEYWTTGEPVRHRFESKVVRHPELGEIELDSDVLQLRDHGIRMMMYSAPPGTAAAQALESLAPDQRP